MSKINLFSFEEMFFVLNFHDATLTPPPPPLQNSPQQDERRSNGHLSFQYRYRSCANVKISAKPLTGGL